VTAPTPAEPLAGRFGHAFSDPALLRRALTHRSHGTDNNERLEFLGDGVLNCVVAETLVARLPGAPEGVLSRLRAGLVNQSSLHEVAVQLGVGEQLRLGEGEDRAGGRERPSILADAFEALVGAVFLDAGYPAARAFVLRHLESRIEAADLRQPVKDPKTRLQEWLQARRRALPAYEVVSTSGEAHARTFEVECRVEGLAHAVRARGSSRRIAEQAAAERAWHDLEAGT
jgi:ribonuclease-3